MKQEEYQNFSKQLQELVEGFTERTGEKMLLMWGVVTRDGELHQEGFNGSPNLGWQTACSLIVGATSFVADWYGESWNESPNSHRTHLFIDPRKDDKS